MILNNVLPQTINFTLNIKNLTKTSLTYDLVKFTNSNSFWKVDPNKVNYGETQNYNISLTNLEELIGTIVLFDDNMNKINIEIKIQKQKYFSTIFDEPIKILNNPKYSIKIISKRKYQPHSELLYYSQLDVELVENK